MSDVYNLTLADDARNGTTKRSSYKTQGPICLTKNSIVMYIPIKIITYYNSKILVAMSSVDGITSDVI